MRENRLAIHSENILPIIKKWLYSDKEIFLRELISNATDALSKLCHLRGQNEAAFEDTELKISVLIDKKQKTLTIVDTGIGMTEEEVEKYIAQIAFSGAEEFVAKYKGEKEPIIGHFGLGFYSSYMVASKVEINTKSYLADSQPVFWSCDGSASYEIGEGKRTLRGTEITLYIDESSEEFLEEAKIQELLEKYCAFMPFPIDLNGKSLKNGPPLWMKAPSDCTEKEYLEFHRKLYPLDPDPLFWIHLNVDYPFHLKGILYFPKIHRRFDANESAIKLFCNRVFVSNNCKEILPDYLMVLRGAIDSPDIPLNVSRSYLQVDQNVKQLGSHISKKVSDKLSLLYKSDRQKYIDSYSDIEMLIKLGILQDEKFYERTKDLLIWKNSRGEWTNLTDYLERSSDKKIYYTSLEHSSLLKLYQEKQIEILHALHPIDTAVIEYLENKLSASFQRIDGAIDEKLLDPSKEKNLLDADGKTVSSKIAELVRSSLEEPNVAVEAKSLSLDTLPGFILLEEKERRLRDYMTLTQGSSFGKDFVKKTFIVNTNNPLVQTIHKLSEKKPDIAKQLAKGVYDLSRLSQKEIEPKDLEKVIQEQTHVLEKLASLLV